MLDGPKHGMTSLLRKALRPSALLGAAWCVFWLGIAALHINLFARRIIAAEFTGGLDQVRLVLALAGAIYCVWGTFRVGNVLRVLDRSPKKMLAVVLVMLIGHLAVSPSMTENARGVLQHAAWEEIIIAVPALAAAGFVMVAFAAIARRRREWRPARIVSISEPRIGGVYSFDAFPVLYQRPPPIR